MLNVVNKGLLQKAREASINEMKEALEHVSRTDVPRWLLGFLAFPLLLWEVTKAGWRTTLAGLVTFGACLIAMLLIVPFMLFIFIDTVLVIRWFFSRILDKMCGDKP